jgi:hypothetical protein
LPEEAKLRELFPNDGQEARRRGRAKALTVFRESENVRAMNVPPMITANFLRTRAPDGPGAEMPNAAEQDRIFSKRRGR